MLDNEPKLIRDAQKGKGECFGQLYDHYLPAIYRYVFMKVSNKHEAEDLTHEVFMSAWQNLERYKFKGFPFSSWLYNIAHNRVIDFYRTKKSHADIEEVDEGFIKVVYALDKIIDTSLEIEKVHAALQEMTDEQQDVILMRFMEDMSHRDIAAAMNKTEGAVRLIQHRAMQNLRNMLSDKKQDTSNDNGRTTV